MIGEIVDGHEIVRPLGTGGMGEVYLGQGEGGSLRAFKVVRADRAAAQLAADRFRREVLALRTLRHPSIIRILDAGRLPSGALYLAMEYVAGPDLQAAIGWDGPFNVGDGLDILSQLAAALAYAHGSGVIHRDLKPSNVVLADGDPRRAKIIDFGLAKIASDEGLTRGAEDEQVLGSPLYWAPEQTTHAAVGPATDVYALGGLAYFVLTGEPMFKARPTVAMAYAHAHLVADRLAVRCKHRELPDGLDALVAACVAKSPAERPSADQLVSELARLRSLVPGDAGAPRSQRLFTRTGLTNYAEALTDQIRPLVLELAALLQRPTDDIDGIQAELSELELDLAMLDADAETGAPDALARREAVSVTVADMTSALADAYRALLEHVDGARSDAPPEAAALYTELDDLIAQYRTL